MYFEIIRLVYYSAFAMEKQVFLHTDTWGKMSVTAECIGDYLTGSIQVERP